MLPSHVPEVPLAEQLILLGQVAVAVTAIVGGYLAIRFRWPHPRRRRP